MVHARSEPGLQSERGEAAEHQHPRRALRARLARRLFDFRHARELHRAGRFAGDALDQRAHQRLGRIIG
jgi:hypothetical protein